MKVKAARKQQERTAVTRKLLLQGAEQVFAKRGYESTRLEEIAAASGFSKGALFAHFGSKEELFLALYESKSNEFEQTLSKALTRATNKEQKIAAFRDFYANLFKQKAWALVVLEMKLFISRHPDMEERLRLIDERIGNALEALLMELFGKGSRAAGQVLGGISSALVLEAQLSPKLITERKSKQMLVTVFDALLSTAKVVRE